MSLVLSNTEEPKKENLISLLQGIFEGHNFSYQTDNQGKVWFVAKDICEILELANSRQVISRLDEDEKGVCIVDTLGGNQEVSTINESGLYSLISTSRKAVAKKFKKYVNSVILPEIRKTGSFNTQPQYQIPQTLSEALRLAADIEEEKRLALQQVEEQKQVIAQKEAFIEDTTELNGLFGFKEAARQLGNNFLLRKDKTKVVLGPNVLSDFLEHIKVFTRESKPIVIRGNEKFTSILVASSKVPHHFASKSKKSTDEEGNDSEWDIRPFVKYSGLEYIYKKLRSEEFTNYLANIRWKTSARVECLTEKLTLI